MIIRSEKWNEKYYYEKLSNGLEVYLMNKPEYKKTYGSVSFNFGSLDIEFVPPFKTEYVKVPLGSAHFLEHEMFDEKNDISLRFAELGAECNAFTTFDRTSYTFNTLNNVDKCIKLLLELTQTKTYTETSINNERNSIASEIKMYENMPNSVHYNECLKSLYKSCNVRSEIGGTIDSINEINKEILDLCFDTFYHPSNMCLVLVGNFDLEHVLNLIKEDQNNKTFRDFVVIKRRYPEELNTINQKKLIKNYELQIPKIAVNLKIPTAKTESMENLKNDLALAILTDYNFDETSKFYEELLNKEVINNTYFYESIIEDGFSYFMISCDTHKYQDFEELVRNKMLNLDSLDELNFIRYKNTIFAANIRKMNNLDYFVSMLTDACFCNLTLFDIFDALETITLEDVNNMKKVFIDELTTSVIFKDEQHQ